MDALVNLVPVSMVYVTMVQEALARACAISVGQVPTAIHAHQPLKAPTVMFVCLDTLVKHAIPVLADTLVPIVIHVIFKIKRLVFVPGPIFQPNTHTPLTNMDVIYATNVFHYTLDPFVNIVQPVLINPVSYAMDVAYVETTSGLTHNPFQKPAPRLGPPVPPTWIVVNQVRTIAKVDASQQMHPLIFDGT
jgi:hypothetical protein